MQTKLLLQARWMLCGETETTALPQAGLFLGKSRATLTVKGQLYTRTAREVNILDPIVTVPGLGFCPSIP